MPPGWLVAFSLVWLGLGVLSGLVILGDLLISKPVLMPVMRWVWPVNALYMGPIAVWAYWTMDRLTHEQVLAYAKRESGGAPERGDGAHEHGAADAMNGRMPHAMLAIHKDEPFWQNVFKGVTHCGSGCTLGDLIAEWVVFLAGWEIAGSALWPEYFGDYVLAYILGIAYQYFAIAPMRGLGVRAGVWAAIKADTLSLTAFEFGLFGWMAIYHFLIFHPHLHPNSVVYWFMMQIGMLLGFLTSYPMNWLLIRKGLKEKM